MTIWRPRLVQSSAPIYRRIADKIEQDVSSGVLLPDSRLPTQRELADSLGVTVVTITRAYREAARRGLLASTVGKGTFVRRIADAATEHDIDLEANVISGGEPAATRELQQRFAASLAAPYGPAEGSERHRAAGAAWLRNARVETTAARVVVTAGAQQAMFAALAATTRAGDSVLCEEVVYQGLHAVAEVLRLRLEPLPLDRFGVLPAAIARTAKKSGARVVYLTPTLQNPTGTILPEKRRRAIAALAEKQNLTVIEDDIYGFLAPHAPPPIASLVPGRSIFLTGLGKSVAAALRIGYACANEELTSRMARIIAATTFFTSPITAEIAATWIEDGTAAKAAAAKREIVAMRQRIARRVLDRVGGDPASPHIWLELPPRRDANELKEQLRARGVRVAAASRFAAGARVPNAIRLSIGAPSTAAQLETALRIVTSVIERAPRADERITV